MFRNYIQNKLEEYTLRYFAAHPEVKLVCVTGSVGKTSTKMALNTILSQQYRVHTHAGNHNTELSAPLAILNIPFPEKVTNPFSWLKVFKQAKQRIAEPANVDIIIQELGADRPGDIQSFGRYLKPDIAIVTAVTPEHMEYFETIEAVAQEELSVANFSKMVVINRDDIATQFASLVSNNQVYTYGTSGVSEYSFENDSFSIEEGYKGYFTNPEFSNQMRATVRVIGEHNLRPIIGAAAVAIRFGMSPSAIVRGVEAIRPVAGRMNALKGVKNSTLLDDTYNSSPAAAAAAIQTLSNMSAPQKIAILGSMNELGQTSAEEHKKLGQMCKAGSIDWVVTIGDDAGRYIAPAAEANGCFVRTFPDAISAGTFVHGKIERDAIVLAKGSQGGIFAEEALKILLHSTDDIKKLVRQDPAWLEAKTKFFSKF